ncbi:MAG: hypothetical protein LPK14_08255 [Hymenobacteraceae bacterium]|nr:hypothetical protein [Hymenobacteraceae bacterium]
MSDWWVLEQIGEELSQESKELLDIGKLQHDMGSPAARKAFEKNLLEVRLHNITRSPVLTMKRGGEGKGVLTVGYRPYEVLEAALL